MPGLVSYPYDRPGDLDRMASEELAQRQKQIDAAWAYYEGNHRRPLKVRAGQPNDNVILNMCRKVIEQAVSLLFGQMPEFEVGSEEDEEADSLLRAIWRENNQPIFLHNLALQGALTGHVFVKLAPSQAGVRFVLLNPRMVTVFWRPDDMAAVTAYSIGFAQDDVELRQDLVAEGGVWLVRDLRRERGRDWQVAGETIWGYPWAPLVEWQNLPDPEEYYGDPDLVRPELNDVLNFLASNTNRILKFHAHPKTIGVGMRASDLQETSVDGFWSIPNPDAKVNNLEMQSDLGSSLAYLQLLQGWFFAEHRAVDMTTFARDLGNITNFGLRTLYKDALDKLLTKRALYGAGLEDLSERALALLGYAERPVVSWPDPLPYNDQEEIAGIQTEMGLGILSKETATGLRGRNWEQEQERIEQEGAMSDNIGNRLLAAFERGQ